MYDCMIYIAARTHGLHSLENLCACFVVAELKLVVLGQRSAACTMLGLSEGQDGESAPVRYTREAAGEKATHAHTRTYCLPGQQHKIATIYQASIE